MMDKFKFGDKVICIISTDYVSYGAIGEVRQLSHNLIYCFWTNNSSHVKSNGWWIDFDQVKLITKEYKKEVVEKIDNWGF